MAGNFLQGKQQNMQLSIYFSPLTEKTSSDLLSRFEHGEKTNEENGSEKEEK